MQRTIERRHPLIVLETNRELLDLTVEPAEHLHEWLIARGYHPFAMDRGGSRARHQMWLHPVAREFIRYEFDVVFVHLSSPRWPRLAKTMRPAGTYWRHHNTPTG